MLHGLDVVGVVAYLLHLVFLPIFLLDFVELLLDRFCFGRVVEEADLPWVAY